MPVVIEAPAGYLELFEGGRVAAYCDGDCRSKWASGEGADIPAQVTDAIVYCVGCGKLMGDGNWLQPIMEHLKETL